MSTFNQTFAFSKMHGLGNDFVVIDATRSTFEFNPKLIKTLAHRHTGIGFDQLLLIQPSEQADFYCQIFNSDGSEALQCGNGLRCVARFIHENQLANGEKFNLETKAGIYPVTIQDYEHIRLTMGAPKIQSTLTDLTFPDSDESISLSILSIGNPHAIVKVDSLDSMPIHPIAEKIASHPYFPEGVNVGFMQIVDASHVRLRTIERGAGETLACGSNACAAAVAGIVNGWLNHPIQVEFECGSLFIEWDAKQQVIIMTGPATQVFRGEMEI